MWGPLLDMKYDKAATMCDALREYEDSSGENFAVLGPRVVPGTDGQEAHPQIILPDTGGRRYLAREVMRVALAYGCCVSLDTDGEKALLREVSK